jgi:hypothetical protein
LGRINDAGSNDLGLHRATSTGFALRPEHPERRSAFWAAVKKPYGLDAAPVTAWQRGRRREIRFHGIPADRLLTQFVRQDIAATSARPQDSQTRQFKPTERDMIRRRTLFGSALADPVLFYCRGRDQVSTGCATLLREPDREVVDRAAPFAFADSSNFLPRWLCSLLLSGTSAWPFPGCRDLRACW